MPHVAFTANIQRHVGCPQMEVVARTVREALEAVFAANPTARSYVLDDQAALRKHMSIYVDVCLIRDRSGARWHRRSPRHGLDDRRPVGQRGPR